MKQITASQILAGAEKAPPFNIVKLTDPEEYEMVPYENFKGAIVGHKYEKEISDLLDWCIITYQVIPGEAKLIYTYFILGLSNILYQVK